MAESPDFRPPAWLRGGMAQTIWANYAPRDAAGRRLHAASTATILATADGDAIRAHWNEATTAGAPVVVLLHGLTGCAQSGQMLGLAAKAHAAGFAVLRADLRNALGKTPSLGVGHAGRSEDVRTLLDFVDTVAPARPVALIGYSLGGNVALKATAELSQATSSVATAVAISVPIDLDAACTAIDSPANKVFRQYFVRRMKRIVAGRQREKGGPYASIDLAEITGIREFDGRVVAPLCGFSSAEDYYARSSALRVISEIRVPTLMVQAVDDPFIPFAAYEDPRIAANPALQILATRRGGHAGFWGRRSADADRFWAEHRAIAFCRDRLL